MLPYTDKTHTSIHSRKHRPAHARAHPRNGTLILSYTDTVEHQHNLRRMQLHAYTFTHLYAHTPIKLKPRKFDNALIRLGTTQKTPR